MDDMPDIADEADSPIVPRPGQILRRAARTKIRKPSLPGDGGGHRFSATRRRGQQLEDSDRSSSDHGDSVENVKRPDSFSEEGLIYDAYARDEDPVTESPPQSVEDLPLSPTEIAPSLLEVLGPILQHPETAPPQAEPPQTSPEQLPQPSRTPSPSSEPVEVPLPAQSPSQPAIAAKPPSPPTPSTHRKEKDKKGLFGKWGGDKASKKANKERERAEKEKESSFFSSLFGGKKNKDSDPSQSMGAHGSAAGREAAQAMLGASKSSKNSVAPTSPNQPLPPGVNNYSRYPIHVERAIYRLSHIKLANPRRPLYEQVLISNLMFWYLGVINKTQSVSSQTNGDAERREREQKERTEKERSEAEQREKERLEAEMDMRRREASSPRRGPLTKPAPASGTRRAEMPVKGPQYEMQHRVMEQEYAYGPQQSPRTSPVNTQYQRPYGPAKMGSPTQESNPEQFYYSGDIIQSPQPYRPSGLPPGAMPPVDQQLWLSQSPPSSPSPPPNKSPPRSRSPPPQQPIYSQENAAPHPRPHRSQSAIVTPSPHVNGKIRKGTSAYAGTPTRAQEPLQNGSAEEEDVPLAVWQQQRRR